MPRTISAYQTVDIGMRMLTPRALYRAQDFPTPTSSTGRRRKVLSKAAQVRMCGNSVSPVLAEVLAKANLSTRDFFDKPANENSVRAAIAS